MFRELWYDAPEMRGKPNDNPSISPMRQNITLAASACVLAAICQLPSVGGDFLNWDDDRFVVHNPNVSALTIENIKDAFSGLRFESYQPLHLVSFMIDGSLWFGRAPLYRAHNLMLFLVGTGLLFALLRRLHYTAFAAFIGCLFFALAPYRTESVAWITGRKDVLMLVFLLGTWHLHLTAAASRTHPQKLRLLAVGCFGLAMLSKSSAMVLPPMMAIADIGRRNQRLPSAFLHMLAYLPFSITSTIVLPMIWSDASLIQQLPPELDHRAMLVLWTAFHYLKTALWPFHLSPIYAAPSPETLLHGAVLGGFCLLGIGTLLAYRVRNRKPIARAALPMGMFFIALLPFLNAIPLYYLRADRYLLLPSIALSIGIAAILQTATEHKRIFATWIAVVLMVFIGAMGIASAYESYQWRNSLALWHHAVNREPDAYFARLKLGETLRNADRPDESVRQYHTALSLRPLSPTALGGVFWGSLLSDMEEVGAMDKPAAETTAYTFVSIANDGPKLQSLSRYLKQQHFLRAAAVVDERLRASK